LAVAVILTLLPAFCHPLVGVTVPLFPEGLTNVVKRYWCWYEKTLALNPSTKSSAENFAAVVDLVIHCSVEVEPGSGFVTVHLEPVSNQYPVGVVVNDWGEDAPNALAVKVGAEYPEPRPTTEYERV
jgi:hypothetical protein